MTDRPTDSPLIHYLGRQRKNRKNLRHEFREEYCQIWGESDCCVVFEPLKEKCNALGELNEYIISRDNIFHHLLNDESVHTKEWESGLTPRRMPIPAKIVFADVIG